MKRSILSLLLSASIQYYLINFFQNKFFLFSYSLSLNKITNVNSYLNQFDVSKERGFLLKEDPLTSLPVSNCPTNVKKLIKEWDDIASELSSLCCASSTRRAINNKLSHFSAETNLEAISYLKQLNSVAVLEKANLNLSFLAHAYVWCDSSPPISTLPSFLSIPWCLVSEELGRPPILTYYSYNACNWKRISKDENVELNNICRIVNFYGGQDEEWFSMVHVAIEARAGYALHACVTAHLGVQEENEKLILDSLKELEIILKEFIAILNRMEEKSDAYIYHHRVRIPMSGWMHEKIDNGMTYEGVISSDQNLRVERYYGETGAQSSIIPSIDAALGLSCDASASSEAAQSLVPYLLEMRQYMPPNHAHFIQALEPHGKALYSYVKEKSQNEDLTNQFNSCLEALTQFRALHLGLAQRFVRQWDKRGDEEVIGTGGTAFMPYLRAHRDATKNHAI